ncbi:hypothetical protein [Rhodopila sp.]|uniref:hypothetical protein n=1 Tax=Rhodopila sp. TaxID=2480087 RepID=UPI003D1414A8
MAAYYHGIKDFRLVHCLECGAPMHAIYDPDIRDTCSDCGGESKSIDASEAREQIRREYLARMRERRA